MTHALALAAATRPSIDGYVMNRNDARVFIQAIPTWPEWGKADHGENYYTKLDGHLYAVSLLPNGSPYWISTIMPASLIAAGGSGDWEILLHDNTGGLVTVDDLLERFPETIMALAL